MNHLKFIVRLLLVIFFLISIFQPTEAQWVQTNGPVTKGNPVLSICIKGSTIYITTGGAIYLSNDFGTHWVNMNPVVPLLPQLKPRMLSLTSNDSSLFADANGIVYKLINGGQAWTQIFSNASNPVDEINSIDSWIIAGSPGGDQTYQSNDNGVSWASTSIYGLSSVSIQDSIAIIGTSFQLYRSTNYGKTWDAVYAFQENPYSVRSVALSGNLAFAGCHNIFKSSNDFGHSWKADSTVFNCNCINSIIVTPIAPSSNYVFAATDSGVFRSSDNGKSWKATNSGLTTKLTFTLLFQNIGFEGKPTIYLGNADGIFRSSDYGDNWIQIGIFAGAPYLATSGNNLFTGGTITSYQGFNKYDLSDYGYRNCEVYRSIDGGLNWYESDSGLIQQPSFFLNSLAAINYPSSGYNLFAGASYTRETGICKIFSSNDYGTSWKSVLPDSAIGSLPALAINPAGVFLGTDQKILRSSDFGNAWIPIDSGATVQINKNYSYPAVINSFSFDGDKIYAGSSLQYSDLYQLYLFNTVFISTNNGSMWTNLGLNIPNGDVIKIQTTISVLSCLYASGSNLIVGMKGYNNSATLPGGGIYHFINNGSNWVLADTALMLRQVVAITAYGINIYAATSDSGVFRSTDNGATWTNINSGLKDLGTGSITISNSYMYATTPSGVWKRPLSEISAVDDNLSGIRIPAECNLSQNYPNPFNPSTIISYQIPTTRFVTLKVYDILGREVKTLVNEQKNAGSYKVSFDGSKLASGVYIYQLCAGGFIKTRKLLLIK